MWQGLRRLATGSAVNISGASLPFMLFHGEFCIEESCLSSLSHQANNASTLKAGDSDELIRKGHQAVGGTICLRSYYE